MKPEVYQKLAASGRYYNTGKVLIGLQYTPRQRRMMSRDEERIQSALLGRRIPLLQHDVTVYALYLIGVAMLVWAVAKAAA